MTVPVYSFSILITTGANVKLCYTPLNVFCYFTVVVARSTHHSLLPGFGEWASTRTVCLSTNRVLKFRPFSKLLLNISSQWNVWLTIWDHVHVHPGCPGSCNTFAADALCCCQTVKKTLHLQTNWFTGDCCRRRALDHASRMYAFKHLCKYDYPIQVS